MKTEEVTKEIIKLLEKSGRIEDLSKIVSLLGKEVRKRKEEVIVLLAEKVSGSLGEKIDDA